MPDDARTTLVKASENLRASISMKHPGTPEYSQDAVALAQVVSAVALMDLQISMASIARAQGRME